VLSFDLVNLLIQTAKILLRVNDGYDVEQSQKNVIQWSPVLG
jgi:hypothetical protein